MADEQDSVIVIGAGVIGLTTALALLLAGPSLAQDPNKPGEGKDPVRVVMPAQIEEHFHHYVLLRALKPHTQLFRGA